MRPSLPTSRPGTWTKRLGKDALKEEVERVQGELREALADTPAPAGAVDWRIEFVEVFDRGGFDVALANPPYIQLQKDSGKLGRLYRDVKYDTFVRTGDVYQLFYERGCQLLRSRAAYWPTSPPTAG